MKADLPLPHPNRKIGISPRAGLRFVLAALMIAMGLAHLVWPAPFARAVPDYLPSHWLIAIVSGIAEIAGGAGLLVLRFRRAAAIGLIALYIAVFPANIAMAMHPAQWVSPPWQFLLWVRLPFQAVFIAWAWWGRR